jgi:pyrroline-5-carboxylate reductase
LLLQIRQNNFTILNLWHRVLFVQWFSSLIRYRRCVMLVKDKVLIVGCGNMGAALAGGYARAYPGAKVLALDHNPARARSLLPAGVAIPVCRELAELADFSPDIVILALKPQVLGDALSGLIAKCAGALVISIAAGVSLASLSRLLGGHPRVVRAMPNLPVTVGQGMSTLYAPALEATDKARCAAVFAAVGLIDWVPAENLIDAATAVAGSGPAYFFALVEHLAAAGVAEGLDERSAAKLKAAVCSPKGTTEAGLAAMETADGLPRVVAAGVAAAHRRARELGVV